MSRTQREAEGDTNGDSTVPLIYKVKCTIFDLISKNCSLIITLVMEKSIMITLH